MDPNATYTFHGTAVVSTLDGVTTVLVAFLFVCLIFPSIVKNRSQYYAALAGVILILLLHTLTLMLNKSGAFLTASSVFTGLLQIAVLLLLVLCVGGLTARQLAGDMARAYEVIRRGETEKEVVIPIGDQAGPRRRGSGDEPQAVYHIDTSQIAGRTEPPTTPRPATRDESIPLS
jgi:hypothetical protein